MTSEGKSCYNNYSDIVISFLECNVNLRLSKLSVVFLSNKRWMLTLVSIHDIYIIE